MIMGRNYLCMSTVYTSDGPKVGMVIALPSVTPQRSVVGDWGCEGEGRWGWTGKLKEASILPQSLFILLYAYVSIYVSVCVSIILI